MDGARRDVEALARRHFMLLQLAVLLNREEQLARPQEDRLVLLVVVLQAQGVALVDVDDLADVAVGLRPVDLVTPGLFDARNLRHLLPPRSLWVYGSMGPWAGRAHEPLWTYGPMDL